MSEYLARELVIKLNNLFLINLPFLYFLGYRKYIIRIAFKYLTIYTCVPFCIIDHFRPNIRII